MAMFLDIMISQYMDGVIDFLRSYLENAGLTRWAVEYWELQQDQTIPEIFSYRAFVRKFLFTGVRDFVVHDFKFDPSSLKVYFDISIPNVLLSLGKAAGAISVFGNNLEGEAKGKVNIIEPRLTGEVWFTMTNDLKVKLTKIDANFQLKAIQSKLKIHFNNTNYSKSVNDFLSKRVPEFVATNGALMNDVLDTIIKTI